jgi:hypothetical protein
MLNKIYHTKFCEGIRHKHLHGMCEILFVNGQLQTLRLYSKNLLQAESLQE